MTLLESKNLPLGFVAPEIGLTNGIANEQFFLEDLKVKKGLLVVFTCNHCPYAQAAWPLILDLYKQFGNQINFVAINSNNPDDYPEDSPEEMKKRVEEWGIKFPYLFDFGQQAARNYQAECTPDPYLFKENNGQFELYYHGRVNDNWKSPSLVNKHDLGEAMQALIGGQAAPAEQMPSMGCSIKWR